MRILFTIIIAGSLIGLGFISKTKEIKPVKGIYAPVALLELFTSEGCSSCPPADDLLPELVKGNANIIPLSFHVDYWNRLGWEDPFSSSEFSDRQRAYGEQFHLESVYTPQLVVNGEYELVGSNKSGAESAIKKALQEKMQVQLKLEDIRINEGKLHFTVYPSGDFTKTDLLGALVQKHATTNVKAGENAGVKLSHLNVVRSFGKLSAEQKTVFDLIFPKNLDVGNWQLVVYAEQKNSLKITGAILYDPSH